MLGEAGSREDNTDREAIDFLTRKRHAKKKPQPQKNAGNLTISGQLKEETRTVSYHKIFHCTTLQVISHKTYCLHTKTYLSGCDCFSGAQH